MVTLRDRRQQLQRLRQSVTSVSSSEVVANVNPMLQQAQSALQQQIRTLRSRRRLSLSKPLPQPQHVSDEDQGSESTSSSSELLEGKRHSATTLPVVSPATSTVPSTIPRAVVSPTESSSSWTNPRKSTHQPPNKQSQQSQPQSQPRHTLSRHALIPKPASSVPALPQTTTKLAVVAPPRDHGHRNQPNHHNHRNQHNHRNHHQIDSLPDALGAWAAAAHALCTSDAVADVVDTSVAVVVHASRTIVHTVAWPVTVPLAVGAATLHVVGTVLQHVGSLPNHGGAVLRLTNGEEEGTEPAEGEWWEGLVAWPGQVVGCAVDMVVGVVLQNPQPQQLQQPQPQQIPGASSSPERKEIKNVYVTPKSNQTSSRQPRADYLDRLRLDYSPNCDKLERKELFPEKPSKAKRIEPPPALVPEPTPSSKYMWRVNDLGVTVKDTPVCYIDLHPSRRSPALVSQALDQFVVSALRLLANHPAVALPDVPSDHPADLIRWNPEGSTKRRLRQSHQWSASEQLHHSLMSDPLVWSGRFADGHANGGYERHHGCFLARGSIALPVREFLSLLWDNRRTHEYNNFCNGRSTLLELDGSESSGSGSDSDTTCRCDATTAHGDDRIVRDGATTSTKVIASEMRVPFAGLTVKAICLMHVRPIRDGYVIVSRTLDHGRAGTHAGSTWQDVQESRRCVPPKSASSKGPKNEILWGCNVLRFVPGRPDLTDLTTLSQVGSGVPSFVAHKIGMMGIGDFFKNVRSVASQPAAVQ